ncbi:MAG TPA: hypothetical protein VFV48_07190, partial [Pseudomonadales bacterium]|nr:hypothetical protein [Pseudomonadales bacterium]
MTEKKRNNQVEIPSVMLSSDDLKSHSPHVGRVTQTRAEKTVASPLVVILIVVLFAAVAFLYYRLHMQQQAFDAVQAHFEQ